MIKTKKIISTVAIVVAMMVALVSSASAANLSWTSNTTVTIGSANYTIQNGSTATSFVLSATNLALVIPATETFTFISPDGYTLALSGADAASGTTSCSGGTQVVITKAGGAATVTITPNTAVLACSSARRTYPTPTPTPTPTATPAPGTGTGATPTPTPTPALVPGPATPAAPSGVTLYRVEGSPRVYVVKEGKREWIKTAEEFIAAGYNWGDIIATTAEILAAIPDITVYPGTLLYRAEGDTRVYVVKDNIKQWIKTAEEFNSKGYKWADIIITTPSVIAGIPEGTVILVRVKVVGTALLRVRQSNTTLSTMIGTVKGGEIFDAMEEKTGWYKITTSTGLVGWISGYYAVKQ